MSSSLLIGLDFGTTTCHCVIAEASLLFNSVLGKKEFSDIKVKYQSTPLFTPIEKGKIDLEKTEKIILNWLSESQLPLEEIIGGGAILTGLTAQSENAEKLSDLINKYFKELLIITLEDPQMESWVSGLGNCQELMKEHPTQTFINFDIGGGTTNIAVCKEGKILSTDCFFIGARHFIFTPGTYDLLEISKYGRELNTQDPSKICEHYVKFLEALPLPFETSRITFSGGVGELLYQPDLPHSITPYGDLGVDLALKIKQSKKLSKDLETSIPKQRGRATVFGIAVFSTQISGDSIFISDTFELPLEVPVFSLLDFTRKSAFFIPTEQEDLESLKKLAGKISEQNITQPLVFLMAPNLGKLFGYWVIQNKKPMPPICVLDEIEYRPAKYAVLGKKIHGIVPLTFYDFGEKT